MAKWTIILAAVLALASGAGAAAPQPAAPDQGRALAIRVAQADAYRRLADLVLAAPLADGRTVGAALGPGSDKEVALRLLIRSARSVGDPRVYSDGVTEVDVEIRADAVLQKVVQLLEGTSPAALDRLRGQAFDGVLSVSGRGTPPQDVPPDRARQAAAARPEDFVQIYPVGWEGVTAAGRVEAESRARIRAYDAMGAAVRAIRLGPAGTLGAMVKDSAGAETLLDTFVRGLPLAGPVRLMPDRIAEADLAAPIRDLIKVLRDIRAMTPQDPRWAETRIDELSVVLKMDRIPVTGRGMPPPEGLRPADALAEPPAAPLPDWAAAILETKARARLPEDTENPDQARLLAARAAKAKALEDLERQLDAVKLDDGRTVRERASKDDVFRRDILTFLGSARTVESHLAPDGRQWEVTLRLPLVRVWEFSRARGP